MTMNCRLCPGTMSLDGTGYNSILREHMETWRCTSCGWGSLVPQGSATVGPQPAKRRRRTK